MKDSPRRHKIHKELLAKVAPAIGSKGFREDRENHYIFEDTKESTVKYLIQWAYCKEYQLLCENIDVKNSYLEHARVYILADLYLIDVLKKLAFTKLTELIEVQQTIQSFFRRDYNSINLAELVRDDGPVSELIELFVYCFSDQLPDNDDLLHWLANFIAWRIDDFLNVPKFREIMPSLSPFIIPAMRSRDRAPWFPSIKDRPKKAYLIDRSDVVRRQECSLCGGQLAEPAANCNFCKATLLSSYGTFVI